LSEEEQPSYLDRVVDALADLLDSLGLNGTRLRWKWKQRKLQLGEAGLKSEILLRSAKGRHKMCPSCRALVPRGARTCPECNASLGVVRAPGVGRLMANVLPRATRATSLLLLVNGFWFVMMIMAQIKSGATGGGLFGGFGGELLIRFGGGLNFSYPEMGTGGEWWRLITPIFLHGGLLHFIFNSYLLLQLGPIVEETYGTERYWVVYLLCGIAGSLVSQRVRPLLDGLMNPVVLTVGASGAIMGLIGLLLVYGYRSRTPVLGQSMKGLIFRLAVYSVILSFVFNLDHLNHIGGFACGAFLALVVPTTPPRSRTASTAWQLAALAGVLLVLFAFYEVATQVTQSP
jgi:rhomboid protease GluP